VDALTEWYCDVLGYETVLKASDTVIIIKAPDGTLVEMMQQNDDARPVRQTLTAGWSHLALRVEDLDAAIAYLDSRGVTWLGDIVPAMGGGRLRSFADPDGNMLQVVERQ
jgi:glyoxylase I family protein